MAELLTDDIIHEALQADGIMQEPDTPWLLEYIKSEYCGELNTESSWAKGNEDRIIYYQTTADSYEVYISTDTHDHQKIYFEQDVYYYNDAEQFAQDIIDSITNGGSAWCDPSIWDDVEYEFGYALEEWWNDLYEDLFEDKKDELLDSGEYTENETD